MVVTIVREITEVYAIRRELKKKEQLNRQYIRELEAIRKELEGNVELVAVDKKSVGILRLAERVAMLDSSVILTGERGVGKRKIAEFIHKHSERSQYPFIRVNFGVISGLDVTSYMIGEADESTGKYSMGLLESAAGGTLYIEEVADIPEEMNGRILALLRGGDCVLGDGMLHHLNIRILAGSRYSLQELREKELVHPQILEELSLFTMEIPSLRERRDDIVPMADYFLNQYNHKTGEQKKLERDSYLKLLNYYWPDNVLELRNVIQRAAIISSGNQIEPEDLYMQEEAGYVRERLGELQERINLKEEVAKMESGYMEQAFLKYGNVREAAESLGMDSSTFVRKRQKYEKMGLMEPVKM